MIIKPQDMQLMQQQSFQNTILLNAFRFFKLGKASAMAWMLFVILLGFTALQFKNASKWVYYEGGEKE